MRLRTVIVAGAVLLAVTSLAGSKNANGTPSFQDATGTAKGEFLYRIHGCHRDLREGLVSEWHRKLKHRHGDDCQPKRKGKGKSSKDGDFDRDRQRGEGGYDDREGQRGERSYDEPGGQYGEGGYDDNDGQGEGDDAGSYEDGGGQSEGDEAGSYGEGPPRGWRSYQQAPYGWEQRGCQQFGPLWFCP